MALKSEGIDKAIRDYLKPFETQDIEAFHDGASLDGGTVGGFGWRTSAWRDDSLVTPEEARTIAANLFGVVEYYNGTLDELNTWSEGDIGLAWGTWTEDFKRKGGPHQVAKVRFTFTLKQRPGGWKPLMYHRDVQPFGKDGRCPIEITEVK